MVTFLAILLKFKNKKYLFASLSGSAFIYFLIRFLVGKAFFGKTEIIQVPIMELSLTERVLQMPKIVFYYLKTFFFPKTLLIDQQWIVKKINLPDFYLPLFIDILFFATLSLIGLYIFRKKREIFITYLFFAIWFVAGLLLHLQIIPLNMTVADRWFYFPLIGLLGLIGVWLQIIKIIKNHKYTFLTIAVIVICALSLRTIVRNSDWKDAISLYSHDLRAGGENYSIHINLGDELMRLNRLDEAKEHFQKSVELSPGQSINWSNLGVIYALQGDTFTAKKYLLKAIKNNSSFYPAYEKYGFILLKDKKFIEARNFLKRTIKKYPERPILYIFLAEAEYKSGNKSEALQAAYKAVQLDPSEYNRGIYNALKSNLPLD